MSPKQPSKQKRAAQNRQQRAARAARKANAHAERPAAGSSAQQGGKSGGFFSRRAAAAQRPSGSSRPSLSEARAMQPPGLRAALSAVFAAVAAIGLCALALRYPVNEDGDLYTPEKVVVEWYDTADRAAQEQPDADPAEVAASIETWSPGRSDATVVKALWPWSIAIVLPLIGAGIALWAVRNRMSSKVVSRALYATLFGAILTQGLLWLFLPVVLAVGVAMVQVRRSEVAAAQAAAGDGVIDVDEVDADLDAGFDAADIDGADIDDAEVIEAEAVEVVEADASEDPDA